MAILSALQSASIRLMGYRPSVFFTSSQKFEIELSDLINEAAQDIAKSNEWQGLTQIYTITGDGTTTAFPFPSDYDRQLVTAEIQDANDWAWGYEHVLDMNTWIFRKSHDWGLNPGIWTMYGNEFQFLPAPYANAQARFPYISKNWARGADGNLKSEFTRDDDEFLLPERLLTLWLIWKWRENKKLDYTGDQENFSKAFDEIAGRDRGGRTIRTGPARFPAGVSIAYPWNLGA